MRQTNSKKVQTSQANNPAVQNGEPFQDDTTRKRKGRLRKMLLVAGAVTGIWLGLSAVTQLNGGLLVLGGPQLQQQVVDAAGKFDAAGLNVDSLIITRSPLCWDDGITGEFINLWPVDLVITCGDNRFTLTHELAHNWIYDNVSQANRDVFMTRFDIPNWNNKQTVWRERGTEATAETVVWIVDPDRFVWKLPTNMKGDSDLGTGWSILSLEAAPEQIRSLQQRLEYEEAGKRGAATWEEYSSAILTCQWGCDLLHGYGGEPYTDYGENNDNTIPVQQKSGQGPRETANRGGTVSGTATVHWWAEAAAQNTELVPPTGCRGTLWEETIARTVGEHGYPYIVCALNSDGQAIFDRLAGWKLARQQALLEQIDGERAKRYSQLNRYLVYEKQVQ